MELGAQLVILGLGDASVASSFHELEREQPDRFRFVERFDAELAQRIYGGIDMFLMPSAFEPCGLGQMIAMRYGALPIVRRTGGLADTVRDKYNGFVFEHLAEGDFLSACFGALDCFNEQTTWEKLIRNAMATDFGWEQSAKKYELLYLEAIESRHIPPVEKAG